MANISLEKCIYLLVLCGVLAAAISAQRDFPGATIDDDDFYADDGEDGEDGEDGQPSMFADDDFDIRDYPSLSMFGDELPHQMDRKECPPCAEVCHKDCPPCKQGTCPPCPPCKDNSFCHCDCSDSSGKTIQHSSSNDGRETTNHDNGNHAGSQDREGRQETNEKVSEIEALKKKCQVQLAAAEDRFQKASRAAEDECLKRVGKTKLECEKAAQLKTREINLDEQCRGLVKKCEQKSLEPYVKRMKNSLLRVVEGISPGADGKYQIVSIVTVDDVRSWPNQSLSVFLDQFQKSLSIEQHEESSFVDRFLESYRNEIIMFVLILISVVSAVWMFRASAEFLRRYRFTAIAYLVIVAVFISIPHVYMQLYQRKISERAYREGMEMPSQCDPRKLGWWDYFFAQEIIAERCKSTYHDVVINPIWEVAFVDVVAEVLLRMFWNPLSKMGGPLGLFLEGFFHSMAWTTIATLLPFILMAFVIFLLSWFGYQLQIWPFITFGPSIRAADQTANVIKKLENENKMLMDRETKEREEKNRLRDLHQEGEDARVDHQLQNKKLSSEIARLRRRLECLPAADENMAAITEGNSSEVNAAEGNAAEGNAPRSAKGQSAPTPPISPSEVLEQGGLRHRTAAKTKSQQDQHYVRAGAANEGLKRSDHSEGVEDVSNSTPAEHVLSSASHRRLSQRISDGETQLPTSGDGTADMNYDWLSDSTVFVSDLTEADIYNSDNRATSTSSGSEDAAAVQVLSHLPSGQTFDQLESSGRVDNSLPLGDGNVEDARGGAGDGPGIGRLLLVSVDHIVLTVGQYARSIDFYGKLGARVVTEQGRVALFFGSHKINLHTVGSDRRPSAYRPTPGSADVCFVCRGTAEESTEMLQISNIQVEEGPVERTGAKGSMTSLYIRDPDLNLIELAHYPA